MAKDWHRISNEEEKKILLENVKFARSMTIFCLIFMFGGGITYNTFLPYSKGEYLVDNVTHRHLAYPSYVGFFNPNVMPAYHFVFFLQLIFSIIALSLTCAVCSITSLCVSHIAGRCSIINSIFANISEDFENKKLAKTIKEHWQCLKFASILEEFSNEIYLVEFGGSTIVICLLGYYLIVDIERMDTFGLLTHSCLFISITFNIFIFCYVGEILTDKCNKIGQAVFESSWSELPAADVKNFILVLAVAQKPVFLTAGKMITLSIRSFTNVLKASATYLNMLRTLLVNNN
uniref:Odorant receptor n=1 Tax=Trichogramma kaykai TaxID=54128 RepID=A0ABD2WJB3_9HYME